MPCACPVHPGAPFGHTAPCALPVCAPHRRGAPPCRTPAARAIRHSQPNETTPHEKIPCGSTAPAAPCRRRAAARRRAPRASRPAERRQHHGPRRRRPHGRAPGLRHRDRRGDHPRPLDRRHGPLLPQEPPHGQLHARRLVGGLRHGPSAGRDRGRQDPRGELQPRGGGPLGRRGGRLGQPHRAQQALFAHHRLGGRREALRRHGVVQPGRVDELPVGPARREQLQQLRHRAAAHQRPGGAVLADTARQPPHLQHAGHGLRP